MARPKISEFRRKHISSYPGVAPEKEEEEGLVEAPKEEAPKEEAAETSNETSEEDTK